MPYDSEILATEETSALSCVSSTAPAETMLGSMACIEASASRKSTAKARTSMSLAVKPIRWIADAMPSMSLSAYDWTKSIIAVAVLCGMLPTMLRGRDEKRGRICWDESAEKGVGMQTLQKREAQQEKSSDKRRPRLHCV
eukprot:6203033-Pleurochrysis_carterae.AAC.1